MSQKRDREEAEPRDHERKKQKKGFQVGPANLPDGTYKRKNKKIKDALIQKAQIRKNYAKVKKNLPQNEHERTIYSASPEPAAEVEEPSTEPHPDRQTLIENEAESPELVPGPSQAPERRERKRKPKSVPFKREYDEAQQRKAEAEERRKAREEAEQQRQQKMEERERFRRAMAKARTGGKNGQRKLGRESNVLLERVKRMVSEG